ncbi:MAG: DUF1553 domain-containing protein [Pirellulaceae bacterium]
MPYRLAWFASLALLLSASLFAAPLRAAENEDPDADGRPGYRQQVMADGPVAYWTFEGDVSSRLANAVQVGQGEGDEQQTVCFIHGDVGFAQPSARPPHYPAMQAENVAVTFGGKGGYLRVADPGEQSLFDFGPGDALTLEAWVRADSVANEQQVYIVGKGRTGNQGFARDNQNYALRLRGEGGTARLSFLFRSADNRAGNRNDFHRWNSNEGFLPGDGAWHHVAVAYEFGKPESIRGYLDGRAVKGSWDYGGATEESPVVDDDELWIGSSMGGGAGSTFQGSIDEVAIYRKLVAPERLLARYDADLPDPREVELSDESVPTDAVLVEIHEGIASGDTWNFVAPAAIETFTQDVFAFTEMPQKYSRKGLQADRTSPFLVRARTKRELTPGKYELLLRSKSAARLYVDGRLVVENGFLNRNSSGHEAVPEATPPRREGIWPLAAGHQETEIEIELDKGEHVFRLEMIAGGKSLRPELGEVCIALSQGGGPFEILTAAGASPVSLTDPGWMAMSARLDRQYRAMEAAARRDIDPVLAAYWDKRHAIARKQIAATPGPEVPEVGKETPVHNEIDRFLGAKLEAAGVQPAELCDDYTFLRRATIDTIGVIPTPAELDAFLADQHPDRRARAIDRLLAHDGWADNWTGYWQDVLAENPGILKPMLNNTGPFRWWIHESLLDNKPMDRFVTELVMMEGSQYGGAPAGFAMATQNDVPMAAKAHVVAQAFLGQQMQCARCHDAPFHNFTQEQLFNVAAMLDQKPISLPKSSTVPVAEGGRAPLVEISLKPGDKIQPQWPFAELLDEDIALNELLARGDDPRERLAASITTAHNERFAQVLVNRMWKRYLGWGIVEPVDDWSDAEPSHGELLRWLARELVAHDYDVKHVARLILNSHAYQRAATAEGSQSKSPPERLFASPARRRMTAEQIVDSLYAAAGKTMDAETLSLDPEGRRPVTTFLNLGVPRRAWEFTSLSNERDRPALALPVSQSIVDLLLAYGWRDARPNPLTVREQSPTVLQPLALANGVVGARVARLSDDNALTGLALQEQTTGELIDDVYLRLLSREPDDVERDMFLELLGDGYSDRRVPGAKPIPKVNRHVTRVSWANHLSAEATRIMNEMERRVRAGDPPTPLLEKPWRERMEDMVWTLVNSPEFVFIP